MGSNETPKGSVPFFSSVRTLLTPQPPSAILTDLAPQILSPKLLNRTPSNRQLANTSLNRKLGWNSVAGKQTQLGHIKEDVEELLKLEVPPAPFELSAPSNNPLKNGVKHIMSGQSQDTSVPLFQGFIATMPASKKARTERRKKRADLGELAMGIDGKLGLKHKADQARGMLSVTAAENEEDLGINKRTQVRRKHTHTKGTTLDLDVTVEELLSEVDGVKNDLVNVEVRRALLHNQVGDVEAKISKLMSIKEDLGRDLLALREEELEFEEELQGLLERIEMRQEKAKGNSMNPPLRRHKGPAFLPNEHDELPPGVAFMTLNGHLGPITALDFTEPYGLAVTAARDDTVKVWDLTTGEQFAALRGHSGMVKALQAESSVCVTGGADGCIRVWDLDKLGQSRSNSVTKLSERLDDVFLGENNEEIEEDPACVKSLKCHTKAITSLYFDGMRLVTGSADCTMRVWDIETGQSTTTMDIMWAASTDQGLGGDADYSEWGMGSKMRSPLRPQNTLLGSSAAVYSDDLVNYEDTIGSIQFWGYALASGTSDGRVRMWDLRTGQTHRTLIGHTGPITSLQFDEHTVISGSLDKYVRIWDLRTGGTLDSVKYDNPVTSLQFDSRKIVVGAGENGVRIYNRTTLQHSTLSINGHIAPVEKIRFMDRYLASGSADCTVKLWALA